MLGPRALERGDESRHGVVLGDAEVRGHGVEAGAAGGVREMEVDVGEKRRVPLQRLFVGDAQRGVAFFISSPLPVTIALSIAAIPAL